MQILKKENKMYAHHTKDSLGDYIKDDVRYTVNTAKEVYAPDTADLSYWIEVDSIEDYVSSNMKDYEYKPLTEEEKREIIEKHRNAEEEANK